MKHIKTFENIVETEYQKNDYVLLKHKKENGEYLIFKINSINYYLYLLIDIINNNDNSGWYLKDDILRKATSEEIEKLKIEIDSKKFNL